MRAMQLAASHEKIVTRALIDSQTCSHMQAIALQLAQMNNVREYGSLVQRSCYLP